MPVTIDEMAVQFSAEGVASLLEAQRNIIQKNDAIGASSKVMSNRTGNAFAALSQAMIEGRGNAFSMASAAGNLIQNLSTLAKSARVAALAGGIGMLITASVALYQALKDVNREVEVTELASKRIQRATLVTVGSLIEQERAKLDRLRESYVKLVEQRGLRGSVGPWSQQGRMLKEIEQGQARLNALIERSNELQHAQHVFVQDQLYNAARTAATERETLAIEQMRTAQAAQLAQIVTETGNVYDMARRITISDLDLREQQIKAESAAAERKIRDQFRQLDNEGRVIELTDEQRARLAQLLSLNEKITAEKLRQLGIDRTTINTATDVETMSLSASASDRRAAEIAKIQLDAHRKAASGVAPEVVKQWQTAALAALDRQTWESPIRGFVNGLSSSIQAGFAKAFERGANIGSIFDAMKVTALAALGGLFMEMGMVYLEYGGIMEALAALLPNPFTAGPAAIAIGAALLALGASLQGVASRSASGARGGGGGGGGVTPPSLTYIGVVNPAQPSSGTATNGLQPVQPVTVNATFIGKDDPRAQRELLEMIARAQRRGSTRG